MAGVMLGVVEESDCACNVGEPDTLRNSLFFRGKNHDAGRRTTFPAIIDVLVRKKTQHCRTVVLNCSWSVRQKRPPNHSL